jgi:hypothetical protein
MSTISSEFNPAQYLTPAQLVERWADTPLAISYVTLARRRAAGKGPQACYAGHNDRVYYHLDAIVAYESATKPHAKPQRLIIQERQEGEGAAA